MPKVTIAGTEFDTSTPEGMRGFALAYIRESSPELSIMLKAISDVMGGDIIGGKPGDPSMLTPNDIIGALILFKTTAHLTTSPEFKLRMFDASMQVAFLPQADGLVQKINQKLRTAGEQRVSTVDFVEYATRAN